MNQGVAAMLLNAQQGGGIAAHNQINQNIQQPPQEFIEESEEIQGNTLEGLRKLINGFKNNLDPGFTSSIEDRIIIKYTENRQNKQLIVRFRNTFLNSLRVTRVGVRGVQLNDIFQDKQELINFINHFFSQGSGNILTSYSAKFHLQTTNSRAGTPIKVPFVEHFPQGSRTSSPVMEGYRSLKRARRLSLEQQRDNKFGKGLLSKLKSDLKRLRSL